MLVKLVQVRCTVFGALLVTVLSGGCKAVELSVVDSQSKKIVPLIKVELSGSHLVKKLHSRYREKPAYLSARASCE